MTGEQTSNGRITWRELSDLLEKRDAKIERRLDAILTRVDPLPALVVRIAKNEEDIKDNRDEIRFINRRSNWWDGINSALILIAGYLGFK